MKNNYENTKSFLLIFLLIFLSGCISNPKLNRLGVVVPNCNQPDIESSSANIYSSVNNEQWEIQESDQNILVLKKNGEATYLVNSNHILIRSAVIKKYFKKYFIFERLVGAKLVVIFDAKHSGSVYTQAVNRIKSANPTAEILRPFMTHTRISPTSPYLNDAGFVEPCKGFPLDEFSLEFILTREEVQELDTLDDNAILLAGIVSFRDNVSNSFYHRSFYMRKSTLVEH